jgi:hypothetical protein
MNDEITEALKTHNNEATEAPYWLIIDPERLHVEEDVEPDVHAITPCITGPFFCREDAEDHLRSRHYAFSDRAVVYCHSGHWSVKYKRYCQELGIGTLKHEKEVQDAEARRKPV